MSDISKPQYSVWTIDDAIGRLESARCSIGWGQLNEDLEVAIECMQYVSAILREEHSRSFEELTGEIDKILKNG